MSELDTSSDSEWLEISSSHDSDDDSLTDASRDSFPDDVHSMPPSRRSSMSIGSPVDGGEIDAWEGFADVASDGMVAEMEGIPAPAEHAGSGRMTDTDLPDSDEQLVNAALEQSLVGTLSASRSSSVGVSTVHSSLRDLRLSFPDPITSSRDELNRSYEAVSSLEIHGITDDVPNSPMTTLSLGEAPRCKDSPLKDESCAGEHSTESDSFPVYWSDSCQIQDFDVVLYGSTAESRDFAQWLTKTILSTAGALTFGDKAIPEEPHRLGTSSSQTLERPSLAIVSLPSAIPHLLKHTLYLPVVFPVGDEAQPNLSLVQGNWVSLAVPNIQTMKLIQDYSIFVDSAETRNRVSPRFVLREMEPLLQPQLKKLPKAVEQLKSVHAVTFVALLSLIMGFAVNTAFRSSSPVPTPATTSYVPAHTTPSTFWDMFGTTPNSSVAPVSTTSAASSVAVMPSTLKDLALAVFNPATTTPPAQVGSISAAPSPSASSGSGAGPSSGESKLARSEKASASTDIILRPQTALSDPSALKRRSLPKPKPAVDGHVGKIAALPVVESVPVTSVSLKVVDSLSEVLEATVKALESVVPHDLRDLMLAFDDLLRAIGRQTAMMVEDTKSRAHILRERLLQRNERAKKRARELKEMGEQFMSFAGERLKERTEIAKTRAHSLKKSLMSTHMWRTYAQAHGEWIEKLDTKRGKRREGKRSHRGGLFAKLKQRRDNRKNRVAT